MSGGPEFKLWTLWACLTYNFVCPMRGECIYCVKEVVNNNKKWIFYSQADLKFGPPLFFTASSDNKRLKQFKMMNYIWIPFKLFYLMLSAPKTYTFVLGVSGCQILRFKISDI